MLRLQCYPTCNIHTLASPSMSHGRFCNVCMCCCAACRHPSSPYMWGHGHHHTWQPGLYLSRWHHDQPRGWHNWPAHRCCVLFGGLLSNHQPSTAVSSPFNCFVCTDLLMSVCWLAADAVRCTPDGVCDSQPTCCKASVRLHVTHQNAWLPMQATCSDRDLSTPGKQPYICPSGYSPKPGSEMTTPPGDTTCCVVGMLSGWRITALL
jgi:hypothetical protein